MKLVAILLILSVASGIGLVSQSEMQIGLSQGQDDDIAHILAAVAREIDDHNGDIASYQAAVFSGFDADGNGELNKDELATYLDSIANLDHTADDIDELWSYINSGDSDDITAEDLSTFFDNIQLNT